MKSRFDRNVNQRLIEVFRDGGYELIHAHTPRTLMVASAVAKKLGCPLIYHVHSPVGRDSKQPIRNWFNSWVERRSLRHVDRLICVSQSLFQYMLSQGHNAKKLRVVRNGVATMDLWSEPPQSGYTFNLGMIALFRPRKGVEVLLEALAELRDRQFDFHLLAVGPFDSTSYETEIYRLVAKLDLSSRITWTGFTGDVNQRLQQMQSLVLPSLFGEGLPMVVLEAMAVGVPVIASRVDGVPEVLRDEIDGLLVDPGNPSELADKIEWLISRPAAWRRLRESAWRQQRDHLSDSSMALGVARVYDELLASPVSFI